MVLKLKWESLSKENWCYLVLLSSVLIILLSITGCKDEQDQSSTCDLSALVNELNQQDLGVITQYQAPKGAILGLGDSQNAPELFFWFAYQPNGELATSQTFLDAISQERKAWWGKISEKLVDKILRKPGLSQCPGMLATESHPEFLDSITETLNVDQKDPVVAAPIENQDVPVAYNVVRNSLNIIAWLLFSVLFLISIFQAFKTKPGQIWLVFFLIAVAMTIRLLSSDRLPIQSAFADFDHLFEAASGIRYVSWWEYLQFQGEYSNLYLPLLSIVFRIFSPSFYSAAMVTTFLGALTIWPVFIIARHISGSEWAGILAALVLACYPEAIYFSNGINLGIPAAFLLAMSFASLLLWIKDPRRLYLMQYILSITLFAAMRPEHVAFAAMLGFLHIWIVFENHAVKKLWQQRYYLVFALLFALLNFMPHLIGLLRFKTGAYLESEGSALYLKTLLPLVGIACAGFVSVKVLPSGRFALPQKAGKLINAGILLLFAILLITAVQFSPYNPLLPVPTPSPIHSHVNLHGSIEEISVSFSNLFSNSFFGVISDDFRDFSSNYLTILEQPSYFPVFYLILLAGALLIFRDVSRRQYIMSLSLVSLPFLLFSLVDFLFTGIAIAEPMRYLIAINGAIAVAVGIGVYRIISHLPGESERVSFYAKRAAVIIIILSPLLTHHAIYTDTLHNTQREYLFTQKAFSMIPDAGVVLYTDHCVPLEMRKEGESLDQLELSRVTSVVNRTPILYRVLALLSGKPIKVVGLSEFVASKNEDQTGPKYFFLNSDCYRVQHPETIHPNCTLFRKTAQDQILLEETIPNKRYTGMLIEELGPWEDVFDLAAYRLTETQVAILRNTVEPERCEDH